MRTAKQFLARAEAVLSQAGVEQPDREAVWLLSHLMGVSAGRLRAQPNTILSPEQAEAFEVMVERRARREPLQYILGSQEFMGLSFRVTPAVLIPRPDTETLVAAALSRLRGSVRIADIGTGSGIVAVVLARFLPEAKLVAVDLSPAALELARANARENGVADQIQFRQGDLLEPLMSERFDAILSNPPYIPDAEMAGLMPEVRDWEPRMALTPGRDGLEFFRRLLAAAPAHLKPGGLLGVEVGAGQAPAVADLFRQVGFDPQVCLDTRGIERAVLGTYG